MSSVQPFAEGHNMQLELPIEELVRRARPLPPYEETRIEDLSEEEESAFFAALAE